MASSVGILSVCDRFSHRFCGFAMLGWVELDEEGSFESVDGPVLVGAHLALCIHFSSLLC